MANNPVGWFEIYVQDMDRARTFYETVFSTRLERLEGPDIEMWAFASEPERPGAPGALVKMEGFPTGGNSTLVYFTCSDCATEAKRTSESGGKIFKEKVLYWPVRIHCLGYRYRGQYDRAALVAMRARPNNSFKPKPLRGSA